MAESPTNLATKGDTTDTSLAAQAGISDTKERRRSSIFDRFRSNKHHPLHDEASVASETASSHVGDDASVYTTNTTNSRLPFLGRRGSKDVDNGDKVPHKKEKRESISDRGAFRIEYTASGVPIAIENKDWPPGVSYKTSSQIKQLQNADGSGGMGSFYDRGAIAPGGETAANVGPDPDWIPGLSEAEREKLRKDKSGRYVF